MGGAGCGGHGGLQPIGGAGPVNAACESLGVASGCVAHWDPRRGIGPLSQDSPVKWQPRSPLQVTLGTATGSTRGPAFQELASSPSPARQGQAGAALWPSASALPAPAGVWSPVAGPRSRGSLGQHLHGDTLSSQGGPRGACAQRTQTRVRRRGHPAPGQHSALLCALFWSTRGDL